MEKIRNLSLRRSFLLYLAAMILSFAVSVALRAGAENFQFYLYRKNISDEQYARAMDDIGYEENLARWGSLHGVPLSDMERFLAESCDFVITWSGLLVPVCGCAAAIFIFYRKKIHPPLEEMERTLFFGVLSMTLTNRFRNLWAGIGGSIAIWMLMNSTVGERLFGR